MLIESGSGQVQPEPMDQGEAFVELFYQWVPAEDLTGRGVRDRDGAAIAVWNFARYRAPGSALVRAYNPTVADHGWESPNTIVEVITDDMPFLVDSVGIELSRREYGIRLAIIPVIDVTRGEDGGLARVHAAGAALEGTQTEAVMQFEVDREADPYRLQALVSGIHQALADVRAAVEDWPMMRQRIREIVDGLPSFAPAEAGHVSAFLEWLDAGNFIFLGYREYELVSEAGEDFLRAVDGSGLGLLRRTGATASPSFARLSSEARSLARAPEPLILTKANSRSTVHRPLYLDYVGVKRVEAGQITGEHRFLGLYTTAAEQSSPRAIPILRDKVERVTRRAAFVPGSYQAKSLAKTLDTFPRDELVQIGDDELLATATGIVALGERQLVRLFVRSDPYERFVSCLLFLPRDRYNTENRERIEAILREAFDASGLEWTVRLSYSKLARLHYVVRCEPRTVRHEVDEIERRIAEATRPWAGDLADALTERHGDERAAILLRRYRTAFPIVYRADWRARDAVDDIDRAEALAGGKGLVMSVYWTAQDGRSMLRCRLVSPGERIALSDVLPILENMGLRVSDERPYEIKPEGRGSTWIYDIGVICGFDAKLDTTEARIAFEEAFTSVWSGELENDRLDALVLRAGLTGREVALLRALVKYLRQAGATFSDGYLQQALTANPAVARLLVDLFAARLDPDRHDVLAAARITGEIERAIDGVASVDHARILRDCLAVVRATLRTNYFQTSAQGQPKLELSLKLDPALIPFLPSPRPRLETFVYSPRLEGIYLRDGYVARGGVRWSERREDFRSEALKLMKAETVRNAVIGPTGAAGAFVCKRLIPSSAREQEAAECYRLFLSALLDVTDNIVGGKIVTPPAVIRHDPDDAYLVVSTAGDEEWMSEVADTVASEHRFWLGDLFSGRGAEGIDERQMGIAARGAWESVRRHFRRLEVPLTSETITVVGIGEVSGEALGSSMLRSPHIKLVAAFDHDHVLLDQSVFARTADEIQVSPEAQQALGVDADALTPDELIRAILCAPVDLLWNAGSGTFIKAREESHAEVGDKRNDGVRVDGAELRCRVVAEASPGGVTQKGRIEYARSGGQINTDAIDSVAAASCADVEVNLSILLDDAVTADEITAGERNQLRSSLTNAIADHALRQSYAQALALSLERTLAHDLIDLHARLIDDLERAGLLDRRGADLPTADDVRDRKAARAGLTSPELSVLLAHAKIALYSDLLESDLPEDRYLGSEFVDSLPAPVRDRFQPYMGNHRFRREIITTDLVNSIIDRGGTTFVSRLAEETGARASDIARAYAAAVAIYNMRAFWREIQELDDVVSEEAQFKMLLQARRLVTRAARWLLQNRRGPLDIAAVVSDYGAGAMSLWEALPELLSGIDRRAWQARVREFADPGVPATLARRVAAMDAVFFAFDIVESIGGTGNPVARAGAIHLTLDRRLELDWLRNRILALPRADIWQTLARSSLRDKLYATHRMLTATVLAASPASSGDAAIEEWTHAVGGNLSRYLATLREIRAAPGNEFTTLLVAVGELQRLYSS